MRYKNSIRPKFKRAKHKSKQLRKLQQQLVSQRTTSLPMVMWQEGRVASHTERSLSLHGSPVRRACSSKNLARATERPYLTPKLPIPVDRSPNSTTCLIIGHVRPTAPNRIHIRSDVFPYCTDGQTDPQTHRQTDQHVVRGNGL